MIVRLKVLLVAVMASIACSIAVAQETQSNSTGQSWEAGLDGVTVDWAEDGSFERIYSLHYQPLSFNDSRGVRKALLISEEKAKAAIIRYLDENVSSGRLVAEVQADFESSSRVIDNDNSDVTSRQIKRKALESLTELTASYASGGLRGVVVLEKGVDKNAGEVWTKVGISKTSIGNANKIASALDAKNLEPMGQSTAKSDGENSGVTVKKYEGDF